jgi:hypothetical protein
VRPRGRGARPVVRAHGHGHAALRDVGLLACGSGARNGVCGLGVLHRERAWAAGLELAARQRVHGCGAVAREQRSTEDRCLRAAWPLVCPADRVAHPLGSAGARCRAQETGPPTAAAPASSAGSARTHTPSGAWAARALPAAPAAPAHSARRRRDGVGPREDTMWHGARALPLHPRYLPSHPQQPARLSNAAAPVPPAATP